MKKVEFSFNGICLFTGLHDGTEFLGVPNIFVTEQTRKEIIQRLLESTDFDHMNPMVLEVAKLRRGADHLISLACMPVKIFEGYHVTEYKDTRTHTLLTAKELFLDGHFFDVTAYPPEGITKTKRTIKTGHFNLSYHGCFENLDEALDAAYANGGSHRSRSWFDVEDEDVLRGEVITRRYVHPEFKIGDLGKSVAHIPPEVSEMSDVQIRHWAEQVLQRAKQSHPEVYWYMETLPLEARVQRLIPDHSVRRYIPDARALFNSIITP